MYSNGVIAFVACLVIGLFAGYVTMSGSAFAGGMFGSMMFFSLDNPFTGAIFPLWVLFLSGLLLLVVFFFMFKR